MESAAMRVARGVALLDEKRPGWWKKVNVTTLEMASTCMCVIGQVEGNFMDRKYISQFLDDDGYDVHGERKHGSRDYGFDAYAVSYFTELDPSWKEAKREDFFAYQKSLVLAEEKSRADYRALQVEWTRIINGRVAYAEEVAAAPVVTWTHREPETVR